MRKKTKLPLIYLWILTILSYVPIAIAIIFSFNANKSSAVWTGFTLKWYRDVFADKSIMTAVINSLVIGLLSTVLSAVIALPAVLEFNKRPSRCYDFIKQIQMLPLMIPEIVLAVSYLAFFRVLKIPFGILSMTLGHMSFCVPYIFLQLESRVLTMDKHPTEAARLMGAGAVVSFFDVTLSYLKPALISGMFLSFAMSLDDVIISVFVSGVSTNTLALKIYSQVKTSLTPKINAFCSLLFLGTIILMIISGVFRNYGVDNE